MSRATSSAISFTITQLKYYLVTFWIRTSFSFNNASKWEVVSVGPGDLNSLSSLANSLCNCFTNALSDKTMLTFALVATSFALVANDKVFLDCSIWLRAGLIVQMMAVLALPPKDDCSIRVSFESLYGMCPYLPLLHPIKHYMNNYIDFNHQDFGKERWLLPFKNKIKCL